MESEHRKCEICYLESEEQTLAKVEKIIDERHKIKCNRYNCDCYWLKQEIKNLKSPESPLTAKNSEVVSRDTRKGLCHCGAENQGLDLCNQCWLRGCLKDKHIIKRSFVD